MNNTTIAFVAFLVAALAAFVYADQQAHFIPRAGDHGMRAENQTAPVPLGAKSQLKSDALVPATEEELIASGADVNSAGWKQWAGKCRSRGAKIYLNYPGYMGVPHCHAD